MDIPDGRKKESIDEILADLNGLLNKMPSILDGIRMPDLAPVDFKSRLREEDLGPEPKILEKSAAEPVPGSISEERETISTQPPDAAVPESLELSVNPEAIPSQVEGSAVAGDAISFGIDAASPISGNSVEEIPSSAAAPEVVDDESGKDLAEDLKEQESALEEAFKMSLADDERELTPASEPEKNNAAYAATRDFGVPDIDMLLKMSEEPLPAGVLPQNDSVAGPAAIPVAADETVENLTIEAESGIEPGQVRVEGGIVELKEEKPEENNPAVPDIPESGGLVLEPKDTLAPEPEAVVSELSPDTAGLPADIESATLTLEPSNVLQNNSEAAPQQPEEEKTMLLVPTSSSAPEEEKTVVYEPGFATAAPARGDLAELSAKTAPDGIPSDRVRTMGFLYAGEDSDFCAEVLAQLDSICLKSPSKPMFIQRAFVKVCEVGVNGNYILQMVSEAKAAGLLCVGTIPQENMYEIENVLSASGVFFRNVNKENFNHSAALDLVMELILR